ncbi:MAG: glycosyltransferase family 87 protein [Candidatus Dormibacter sp.]
MNRRLKRWLLGLLVALAVAGAAVVIGQPRAARQSADFNVGYSAALLIREGRISAPYDQPALATMLVRTAGPAIDQRLSYNQPLAADLPFLALSLLAVELAFHVWQVISLGILVLTVVVLQRALPLPKGAPAIALLALLGSVPLWATLTEGQVTPLLALGAALVILALVSDGALAAAAGGALLAFKPHYLPAFLILLFAARRWRLFASAAAASLVFLLSPLAAGGVDGMVAMVHSAFRANDLVSVARSEAWIGMLAPVIPAGLASAVSVVIFGLGLAFLFAIALRRPAWPAFAVLAGLTAVLESPHALPHDLLILAGPAWLAFQLHRQGRMPSPVVPLLLLDAALLLDQRAVGVVLGPVVMTAMIVWGWQSVRRRTDRRRAPAAAA